MDFDETHDPELVSWVESAAPGSTDFPIQNLPLGVFRRRGSAAAPRVGVAIGDQILDLAGCRKDGFLAGLSQGILEACDEPALNSLMGLGATAGKELRLRLSRLLAAGGSGAEAKALSRRLLPMLDAEMLLPARIGDYTDFYASAFHAHNVGSMFRPDNPLMPNYRYLPVAYHGRSSSIVPSGAAVFRPAGQVGANVDKPPEFVPTRELDYELEVGFFVGQGNVRGVPLSIEDAEDRIFGFCLVNDWSARDIQRWEYQPLGPFLGKSFATTISPWVVTLEALAPFRAPAFVRPADDPQPLPHLTSRQQMAHGGIDLELEVRISTAVMRAGGTGPVLLSRSNFQSMYWTAAQMLTHHASNGCNLVAGDLLASGTVSGPSKESRGCLLELAWRGEQPVLLRAGESRTFLQDGDEIVFRGMCHREGFVPIGFGECRGQIAAVPGF